MFRTLRWSAPAVAALMLMTSAGPAEAQVTATVVMKSGERHQGQTPWTRVDKGEFSLRKSQHDELRVPVGDVAYVDFGGSGDANVQLSGSQHAVVLRNGTVVKGQLIEMAHTTPTDLSSEYLVVIRDEQGQERRFPSGQVGRVYFSAPNAGTSGSGSQNQPSGNGIVVAANRSWTSTGITVRRGETLQFNTTGDVQLSLDTADMASAAGSKSQRYAPGAPLPRAFAGALIGRIGANGRPFAIGNQTSVQMPEAGQLFIGVNDDNVADNNGEFRVEITQSTTRRR